MKIRDNGGRTGQLRVHHPQIFVRLRRCEDKSLLTFLKSFCTDEYSGNSSFDSSFGV